MVSYLCNNIQLDINSMTTENKNKHTSAVIIANGRYPHHSIPLSEINNASYIVCCDGAANTFIESGLTPNAIVGDLDSISEENKIKYADILHHETEQENNDLSKAVLFCIKQNITNITIVGGTGLREDHTIGNISLLAEYVLNANVRMVTNWGVFTPIKKDTTFKSFAGEKVSIFAIDPTPMTVAGLKYEINNRVLTNWWQGTLNESLGEAFSISTKGRVIIFQAFE